MPPKAYIYPLPYEYYKKYGIRRYGFHGTSHRYVSGRLAEILDKPVFLIENRNLSSGQRSSIAAIDGGRSWTPAWA
jgi:acetate kinase